MIYGVLHAVSHAQEVEFYSPSSARPSLSDPWGQSAWVILYYTRVIAQIRPDSPPR